MSSSYLNNAKGGSNKKGGTTPAKERQQEYPKELLSALEVINDNNELERRQMQIESEQGKIIPEITKKISIMDVIESSPSQTSARLKGILNQEYNNHHDKNKLDDDLMNNPYEDDTEPMTFNPNRDLKGQSQSNNHHYQQNRHQQPQPYEHEHISTSFSQSSFNITSNSNKDKDSNPLNVLQIIINDLKERIKEEYHQIDLFSKHISKSFQTNQQSQKDILNSIIDFISQTKDTFHSLFNDTDKQLAQMKEAIFPYDQQLRQLENSIHQVTKSFNYNLSQSQSSAMKFKELNTSNDSTLVNQLNSIDQIASIYKTKIVDYQDQIETLKNHIIYYQKVLMESKGLIDELYEKNQLLTQKLIKYKEEKENRGDYYHNTDQYQY